MTPEQEALREMVARAIASDCHDERCYGERDHYETADAAIAVVLKEAANAMRPMLGSMISGGKAYLTILSLIPQEEGQ